MKISWNTVQDMLGLLALVITVTALTYAAIDDRDLLHMMTLTTSFN